MCGIALHGHSPSTLEPGAMNHLPPHPVFHKLVRKNYFVQSQMNSKDIRLNLRVLAKHQKRALLPV